MSELHGILDDLVEDVEEINPNDDSFNPGLSINQSSAIPPTVVNEAALESMMLVLNDHIAKMSLSRTVLSHESRLLDRSTAMEVFNLIIPEEERKKEAAKLSSKPSPMNLDIITKVLSDVSTSIPGEVISMTSEVYEQACENLPLIERTVGTLIDIYEKIIEKRNALVANGKKPMAYNSANERLFLIDTEIGKIAFSDIVGYEKYENRALTDKYYRLLDKGSMQTFYDKILIGDRQISETAINVLVYKLEEFIGGSDKGKEGSRLWNLHASIRKFISRYEDIKKDAPDIRITDENREVFLGVRDVVNTLNIFAVLSALMEDSENFAVQLLDILDFID